MDLLARLVQEPDSEALWSALSDALDTQEPPSFVAIESAARAWQEAALELSTIRLAMLVGVHTTGKARADVYGLAHRIALRELIDVDMAREIREAWASKSDLSDIPASVRAESTEQRWEARVSEAVRQAGMTRDPKARADLYAEAAYGVYASGALRATGEHRAVLTRQATSWLEESRRHAPFTKWAARLWERVLLDDGRYAELIQWLNERARTAPEESEALRARFLVARVYRENARNFAGAVEAYQAVLARVPGHPRATRALGALYERAQAWDELIALYTAQFEAPGVDSASRHALARTLAQLEQGRRRRPAEADRWFEFLRASEPADPEALAFFRVQLAATGQWGRLRRVVEEALLVLQGENSPLEAELLAELPSLQQKSSVEDAEVRSARQSWRVGPPSTQSRDSLLASYERTGRYDELIDVLRRELEVMGDEHPELPQLLSKLYRTLRERGNEGPEWRRVLERMRRIDPRNTTVLAELCTTYDKQGRDEEAVLIEEELAATAATEEQSSAYFVRAATRRFERLGDPRGAMATLTKALRANPSDARARALYIQYAQHSGRTDDALAWLRERSAAHGQSESGVAFRRDWVALLLQTGQERDALDAAWGGLETARVDVELLRLAREAAAKLDAAAYDRVAEFAHAVAENPADRHEVAIEAARVHHRVFAQQRSAIAWYRRALEVPVTRADVVAELREVPPVEEDVVRIAQDLTELGEADLAATFVLGKANRFASGEHRMKALVATMRPGEVRPDVLTAVKAELAVELGRHPTRDIPAVWQSKPSDPFAALTLEAKELQATASSAIAASVLALALGLPEAAKALACIESAAAIDALLGHAPASDVAAFAAHLSADDAAVAARFVERMVAARPEEVSWVDCASNLLLQASEAARFRRVMRLAVDAAAEPERRKSLLVRWADAEEEVFASARFATERSRELLSEFPDDRTIALRFGVRAARAGDGDATLASLQAVRSASSTPDPGLLLRIAEVALLAGNDELAFRSVQEAREAGALATLWVPLLEGFVAVPTARARAAEELVPAYEQAGRWGDLAISLSIIAEEAEDRDTAISALMRASEAARKAGDKTATFDYLLRAATLNPSASEGWWAALAEATLPARLQALATALDEVGAAGADSDMDEELEWELREGLVTRSIATGTDPAAWIDVSLRRMLALRPGGEWAQEVLLSRLSERGAWSEWVDARFSFGVVALTQDERLDHLEQSARVALEALGDAERALAILDAAPDDLRTREALFKLREESLIRLRDRAALRACYVEMLDAFEPTTRAYARRRLFATRAEVPTPPSTLLGWLRAAVEEGDDSAVFDDVLAELYELPSAEDGLNELVLSAPARMPAHLLARAHDNLAKAAHDDRTRAMELGAAWDLRRNKPDLNAAELVSLAWLVEIAPPEALDDVEAAFARAGQLTQYARALAKGCLRSGDIDHAAAAARLFMTTLEDPSAARRVWQSFCDASTVSDVARAEARRRWAAMVERAGGASDIDALLERSLDGGRPLPASGDVLERLARLRAERLGDNEGAARVWKLVLETDPDNPRALEHVQQLYENDGDTAALLDVLERRLGGADEKQRAEIYERLVSILEAQEQWERALDMYERAWDDGVHLKDADLRAIQNAERLAQPARLLSLWERSADDDTVPLQRRVAALEGIAGRCIADDHARALDAVRRALALDPVSKLARGYLIDLMAFADVAGEASALLLPYAKASGDIRAVRATLDTYLRFRSDIDDGDGVFEMAFTAAEQAGAGSGLRYAISGLEASMHDIERVRVWIERVRERVLPADAAALDEKLTTLLDLVSSGDVALEIGRLAVDLALKADSASKKLLLRMRDVIRHDGATVSELMALFELADKEQDVEALKDVYEAARSRGQSEPARVFGLGLLKYYAEAGNSEAVSLAQELAHDGDPVVIATVLRQAGFDAKQAHLYAELLVEFAERTSGIVRDELELESAKIALADNPPLAINIARGILERGDPGGRGRAFLSDMARADAWSAVAEADEMAGRYDVAKDLWLLAAQASANPIDAARYTHEALRAATSSGADQVWFAAAWLAVLESAPEDTEAYEFLRGVNAELDLGFAERVRRIADRAELSVAVRVELYGLAASMFSKLSSERAAPMFERYLSLAAEPTPSMIRLALQSAMDSSDTALETRARGLLLGLDSEASLDDVLRWVRAAARQGATLADVQATAISFVGRDGDDDLIDALLLLPGGADPSASAWAFDLLERRLASSANEAQISELSARAARLASGALNLLPRAAELYERALALGPEDLHLAAEWLSTLERLGRVDAAAKAARRIVSALEAKPHAEQPRGITTQVFEAWRTAEPDEAAEWAWKHADERSLRAAISDWAYRHVGTPVWGARLISDRLAVGDDEAALQLAKKVLPLPEQALRVGRMLLARQEHAEALRVLTTPGIALEPELRLLQAWSAAEANLSHDTLRTFVAALEDSPSSDAIDGLSRLLERAEPDDALSLRAARLVQRKYPSDMRAARRLATQLERAGQLEELLALVEPLLSSAAEPELLQMAIRAAEAVGDAKALAALRRQSLGDAGAEKWAELAREAALRGADQAELRALWAEVVTKRGATLEHVGALVRAEVLSGNADAAKAHVEEHERRARPKPKELAQLRRELAAALESAGYKQAARESFDAAFRADPTHVPTLWRLAELSSDLGMWVEAKRCYRALLLQKWTPESGRTREDIYAELEKIERELSVRPL